jgi:hypothetical protein
MNTPAHVVRRATRRGVVRLIVAVTLIVIPSLASALTLALIEFPRATFTQALGINDRRQIVGMFLEGGRRHGFLLENGAFARIDVPGATDTVAQDIDKDGRIVGSWTLPVAPMDSSW